MEICQIGNSQTIPELTNLSSTLPPESTNIQTGRDLSKLFLPILSSEEVEFDKTLELARSTAYSERLLKAEHIAYCMGWKNIVNPESKTFKTIYGCAGPDLSVPLLLTDCNELVMVDQTSIKKNILQEFLLDISSIDARNNLFPIQPKVRYGYYHAIDLKGKNTPYLITKELKELGATNISAVKNDHKGNLMLEFDWQYPGTIVVKKAQSNFCNK